MCLKMTFLKISRIENAEKIGDLAVKGKKGVIKGCDETQYLGARIIKEARQ